MEKAVEKLNKNAERLGEMGDELDIKMSAMLVQFDTLVALHKDERVEFEKMHHESMERLTKHFKHIIIALALTLILFIGGVIGTVAYVLNNFDIGVVYQDTYVGGDGTSTINDGIHYDRTD